VRRPGLQYDSTINDWHNLPEHRAHQRQQPVRDGDTLVATANGWRRIDELVGCSAEIIGADGQPHFVDRIFPTGTKQVFRLRTRAGYEVRITADHKVWTIEARDVPLSKLNVGDRLRWSRRGSVSGPSTSNWR